MRLVSYGPRDGEHPGFLTDTGIVPLSALDPAAPGSWRAVLAGEGLPALSRALRGYAGRRLPVDTVRLGPPITDPSKIICVGLNYRGHATEQNLPWPERPLLFGKAPSALAGCRDVIELPAEDGLIDYEVELAVVIGRRARAVPAAQALDHVAGYLVANDVTARRWQKGDGQWFRAKSCDSFFPCGPALTTSDEVSDHRALRLTTRIGEDLLQDALAADLIHDLPELIAYISRDMTLVPGDIISTGTPAGVGCYREPKRFLQAGQLVRCAIAGLGELANPVVAAGVR